MLQPWRGLARIRGVVAVGYLLLSGCAAGSREARPLSPNASQWKIEAEQAAFVTFGDTIDIETPAGLSLWFTRELRGPVTVTFDALAVSEGGANDAVSDLNAFWMARDPGVRGGSVFARKRSGAFAEYDDLKTYYAGIGGNRNTTTRFRPDTISRAARICSSPIAGRRFG
jgi:hypothetical protein